MHRMPEMYNDLVPWMKEGKIKYRETFSKGFESLPKALNGLFYGENLGKMIVEIPL